MNVQSSSRYTRTEIALNCPARTRSRWSSTPSRACGISALENHHVPGKSQPRKETAVKVVNSIDINASPAEVFYWIEEPDRGKQWMTSVTRSEIINETPGKVGTTFREYVEDEGRGLEMHGVVTEFVPNERFAVHLESKVNTVNVTFSLEQTDRAARLVQHVDMHFKGVLKVLSLFLRASIRKKIVKQFRNDFSRLKALCEQTG